MVYSEMSRENGMAERNDTDLFGLLNEIIAKGGLPPSARDKLRYRKILEANKGDDNKRDIGYAAGG
jgi:hypothetical protein